MTIAPCADGKFLVWSWTYVPDVGWGVLTSRVVDRVPELRRPSEHSQMFIGPVVTGATHRVALVPREVFVDRMCGIRGEFRSGLGKFFEDPEIKRRQG